MESKVERTNKEIKRRSKVVGAFLNQESVLRLIVSILIDINEEWIKETSIYNGTVIKKEE